MKSNIKIFSVIIGAILAAGVAHFLGKTEAQGPEWGPYPPNYQTRGSTIVNNNGVNLTNLTYAYTTNAILPGNALYWGKAFITNLTANVSFVLEPIDPTMFETIVLVCYNTSGADRSVTLPANTWGTPSSGTPPVYWCTNNALTRIMVEHYGASMTNSYKLDFAP